MLFRSLAASLILSASGIEQLLGLKLVDVRLTLRRVHSVINVPSRSSDRLTAHHASFLDFLKEPMRSNIFHVGIGGVHHQNLAVDIVRAFCYTHDDCSVNAIGHIAW